MLVIKGRLDPHDLFASDLARRVGIDPATSARRERELARDEDAVATMAAATQPSRTGIDLESQ